ncbi:MAG: HAD-IIB family hydrolase [Vicinamibacterales bacterium]
MRYLALATDYDGTLATQGRIAPETFASLERLRGSGRRVILVTGRRFDDLKTVCPHLDPFDAVVAENGAVLHWPATRETAVLGPAPPPRFLQRLKERRVTPLAVGAVVVATAHPNETAVIQVIHELALELQIVFNRDEVMVLPPGINKGTGLQAALARLGLSPHEVVAIGDSANDHSLLQLCECAAATAEAPDSLKGVADFTTRGGAGAAVRELVDELVETDLAGRSTGGQGAEVALGLREDGSVVTFKPYGHNLLIAGPSASGKSTFATGLIERLTQRSYQLCVIDPEGDYGTLSDLVTLGSRLRAPHIEEILAVLEDPATNLVVNLLGVSLADRPDFFAELFPSLLALRARTGRPHWILIDEVHHLLPSEWSIAPALLPQRLGETIMITVHPMHVAAPILRHVDVAVAVGPRPESTLAELAAAIHQPLPRITPRPPARGEVVVWDMKDESDPARLKVIPARAQRLRHLRKYAEGNVGPRSFFFRGPDARLNLRAQNLVTFCELGMGVDEATWLFHLRAGDYSRWLRDVIKDPDLAREVAAVEREQMSADQSRRLVRDAIDQRYTLPGG